MSERRQIYRGICLLSVSLLIAAQYFYSFVLVQDNDIFLLHSHGARNWTLSSTSLLYPDAPLQVKLDWIRNCTGTPRERRALAKLGDQASPSDWQAMTKCVLQRQHKLRYIFGLHVSKAGGTSLCNLFKDQKGEKST